MAQTKETQGPQGEAPQTTIARDTLVDIIDVPTIKALYYEKLGNHPELKRIQKAAKHAEEALEGRTRNKGRRKGETIKDIVHAARVGIRLIDAGVTDTEALVLAWEHDVPEDTAVTPEEIEDKFGKHQRKLVVAMSRSVNGGKEVTDEAYRDQIVAAGIIAEEAKLGDRIDNLWALLRMEYDEPFKEDEPKGRTAGQVLIKNLAETERYFDAFTGANSILAAALEEAKAACRVRIAEHTPQPRDSRMKPQDQPAA